MKVFVADLVNEYMHVVDTRYFKAETRDEAITQLEKELDTFMAHKAENYDVFEVDPADTRTVKRAKNYFKSMK